MINIRIILNKTDIKYLNQYKFSRLIIGSLLVISTGEGLAELKPIIEKRRVRVEGRNDKKEAHQGNKSKTEWAISY